MKKRKVIIVVIYLPVVYKLPDSSILMKGLMKRKYD